MIVCGGLRLRQLAVCPCEVWPGAAPSCVRVSGGVAAEAPAGMLYCPYTSSVASRVRHQHSMPSQMHRLSLCSRRVRRMPARAHERPSVSAAPHMAVCAPPWPSHSGNTWRTMQLCVRCEVALPWTGQFPARTPTRAPLACAGGHRRRSGGARGARRSACPSPTRRGYPGRALWTTSGPQGSRTPPSPTAPILRRDP